MKRMGLATIGKIIASIGLMAIGLAGDRSSLIQREVRRESKCSTATLLTEVAADRYDANGVKTHGGTLLRPVTPKGMKKITAIVFPQALSPQTWTKLPPASIQYLGKGGEKRSWRDRWNPDYFYLLDVPPQATGLAFGRLCYRNGDATVYAIDKLEEDSEKKAIVVNDKMFLSRLSTMPTLRPFQILVNAGSDRRDVLGIQTQVYFTEQFTDPNPPQES